jgi:hypothetical protein
MPNLFPKAAGVVQADKDAGLESVFGDVYKAAGKSNHPMLLPIQLFEAHFITSQKKFEDIIKAIDFVAKKIAAELTSDKKQGNAWVNKIKDDEHAKLSQKLHLSSLDLVELERRRDFEKRLGELLERELATERSMLELVGPYADISKKRDRDIQSLLQRVGIYADMSRNRDLDIQNLPWRIESQRNVVSAF